MGNITEIKGDLFASPPNSVLIHACNCQGVWGTGVAAQCKKLYPAAYELYRNHCLGQRRSSLLGTTFLISPQASDHQDHPDRKHWIACLFTSVGWGKDKSSPEVILEATGKAMKDLERQRKRIQDLDDLGEREAMGELVSCRLNSGRFGVPWERTREVLEEVVGVELKIVDGGT